MLLFLLRSLLCQGPRVLWKVLLSPYCPSFPHQRLKTVGKPHLANCFLSLHPNLKKKRKLFVPEREVGGIVCAICTYWSATPFHLLQGCSTRPFSKETHRGRCVLCWVCVCVCVCDMRTQDLFLSDSPSPILPSHPINSLKQLINAILLDPNAGLFSKAHSFFSAWALSGRAIGHTFSSGRRN